MYSQFVSALLEQASVHQPSSFVCYRRALEVVEGSKSRLLTQLVSRGEFPAPATISQSTIIRERELVTRLSALDTMELTTHDHPAIGQEDASRVQLLRQREENLHELEQLWAGMAKVDSVAIDYVALRLDDVSKCADFVKLAATLDQETAPL